VLLLAQCTTILIEMRIHTAVAGMQISVFSNDFALVVPNIPRAALLLNCSIPFKFTNPILSGLA